AIKQASPFRTTIIVELSNVVETIYIPHRAAYAGGSYEVTNSTVMPGSGEMLVESAVRLLRQAASENEKVKSAQADSKDVSQSSPSPARSTVNRLVATTGQPPAATTKTAANGEASEQVEDGNPFPKRE